MVVYIAETAELRLLAKYVVMESACLQVLWHLISEVLRMCASDITDEDGGSAPTGACSYGSMH